MNIKNVYATSSQLSPLKIMNSEPEYLLSKEFINGPIVAYYSELIEDPFGFNFGGLVFYNGLALAIIDRDEIEVQERKIDEENQPTGPLFIPRKNEDGSTTYTSTGQQIPPLLLVDTTISGKNYLNSYADGFNAGRKYFSERYQPSAAIIYGPEVKYYTENLNDFYNNEYEGWKRSVKEKWRFVTHKVMAEYGYYAGLCYSIDLLIKEYPHLEKPIKEGMGNPKTVLSDTKKVELIKLFLAPLGGVNPQKNIQIMKREDFERLLNHTEYLVLTNSVPSGVRPISKTEISNEHIRYTFYKLHKELFGIKKRQSFIDFLHVMFTQFEGTTPSTTYQKFSVAPKAYYRDFAGYFGESS